MYIFASRPCLIFSGFITIVFAYLIHKFSSAPLYKHILSPIDAWKINLLDSSYDKLPITSVSLVSLLDISYIEKSKQIVQTTIEDISLFAQPSLDNKLHAWERGIPVSEVIALAQYWLNTSSPSTPWSIETSETIQKLQQYPAYEIIIQQLPLRFLHILPLTNQYNKKNKHLDQECIPVLLIHGWPGSILEFLDIIPYLLDANYCLIIPSLPGYGFSNNYTSSSLSTGLDPVVIAEVFLVLMRQLNYSHYYVQGGDWGGIIATLMAQIDYDYSITYSDQYELPRIQGLHLNFITPNHPFLPLYYLLSNYLPKTWFFHNNQNIERAYALGIRIPGAIFLNKLFYPSTLSSSLMDSTGTVIMSGLYELTGYFHEQSTRPDTLGIALTASPFGFLSWVLEKFYEWSDPRTKKYIHSSSELLQIFNPDWLMANAMLYIGTHSITSSLRLYYEAIHSYRFLHGLTTKVQAKVWIADFPYEIGRCSESLLKYRFPNLYNISTMERGGHFAAVQEPELLANDIIMALERMR